MKRIPARPDIGHLKKQAKELLALHRTRNPEALARFRAALPAAAGRSDDAIVALGLRLHDAQSCIAREHGFVSWPELQGFVQARRALLDDPARAVLHWLRLSYAGDIAGGTHGARPALAVRVLDDTPGLLADDPWLACAVGDGQAVRRAIANDPGWVHRPGGALMLPPLVAVAHSGLLRLPACRERLRACARLLLDAGADPGQSVGNRWPPASLDAPDESQRLSALYGAAGQHHDPVLAQMLLDAGADPNDGESLYHALDSVDCTRRLLEAGARVAGTNAMYRVLDLDAVDTLRLLLAHGGDPNEPPLGAPTSDWGSPLLWAVRRRRSAAHVEALLAAGADPAVRTADGTPGHVAALRFGLPEVARLLQQAGSAVPLAPSEAFVAACAQGDEATARAMLAADPGLVKGLLPAHLRLLPELAAQGGCHAAVKLMVALGWPVATRAGDWNASALNLAVFRGDAVLARFLLEHGASWLETHGYGDNVCGSLSWGSCNQPEPGGDWVGCAEALLAHGMPGAQPDPDTPDGVFVGTRRYRFSDAVTDCLLGAPAQLL